MKFIFLLFISTTFSAWWTTRENSTHQRIPPPTKNIAQRYQNSTLRVHIYNYATRQPSYINSGIAVAIDHFHYITPFANFSNAQITEKTKVFIERPKGMTEVYIKNIDLITGFVLLYCESPASDYVAITDLVSTQPQANEKYRLISSASYPTNGISLTYKGKGEEKIRNFHSLTSNGEKVEPKHIGALIVNSSNRIKGIYQGEIEPDSYYFSPIASFIGSYDKAKAEAPSSFNTILAQLRRQGTNLQRKIASLMTSEDDRFEYNIDQWKLPISKQALFCQKENIYSNLNSVFCGIKMTNPSDSQFLTANAKISFHSFQGSSQRAFAQATDEITTSWIEKLGNKATECFQRRVLIAPGAGDAQIHACIAKKSGQLFQIYYRAAFVPKKSKGGILAIELDGYDQDEAKRILHYFTHHLRRPQ